MILNPTKLRATKVRAIKTRKKWNLFVAMASSAKARAVTKQILAGKPAKAGESFSVVPWLVTHPANSTKADVMNVQTKIRRVVPKTRFVQMVVV